MNSDRRKTAQRPRAACWAVTINNCIDRLIIFNYKNLKLQLTIFPRLAILKTKRGAADRQLALVISCSSNRYPWWGRLLFCFLFLTISHTSRTSAIIALAAAAQVRSISNNTRRPFCSLSSWATPPIARKSYESIIRGKANRLPSYSSTPAPYAGSKVIISRHVQ